MSKSLGNSPEALELIEKYGADGVRFGLLSSTSAGSDIIFDAPIDPATGHVLNESKICEQGRNFCNKMWNALRLVKGWETEEREPDAINSLAVKWLRDKFNLTLASMEANFDQYRLSDVLMGLYQFIWDDFCSWYLEMIKPANGRALDRKTYEATISLFEKMMVALHPFMPFVTEELWHQLHQRHKGNDCIVQHYPIAGRFDKDFIQQVEKAKDVISKVRETRNSKGISAKEPLQLCVEATSNAKSMYEREGLIEMVDKIANLSGVSFTEQDPGNTVAFISGTEKYYLEMKIEIDVEAERERITKDLEYNRGFKASVEKKLGNERFVNSAPAQVVELERKKLADAEEKIRLLEEALAKL